MVKGISRQVIVVQSPSEELFDQAIFILKDNAPEVSEEKLLQDARRLLKAADRPRRLPLWRYGPVWAAAGAAVTGIVWLLTAVL